jgi:hypothetical protein
VVNKFTQRLLHSPENSLWYQPNRILACAGIRTQLLSRPVYNLVSVLVFPQTAGNSEAQRKKDDVQRHKAKHSYRVLLLLSGIYNLRV